MITIVEFTPNPILIIKAAIVGALGLRSYRILK